MVCFRGASLSDRWSLTNIQFIKRVGNRRTTLHVTMITNITSSLSEGIVTYYIPPSTILRTRDHFNQVVANVEGYRTTSKSIHHLITRSWPPWTQDGHKMSKHDLAQLWYTCKQSLSANYTHLAQFYRSKIQHEGAKISYWERNTI
jgi:hypothetical protein